MLSEASAIKAKTETVMMSNTEKKIKKLCHLDESMALMETYIED